MRYIYNLKSTRYSLLALLCSVSFLISCGGGGGGGGGSSSSSSTPTPFTITTIDTAGDVGWYSSLALGSLHIAYVDGSDPADLDLKYATCNPNVLNCSDASNWSTEVVDNSTNIGSYSSIAIDSGSNLHISYYDDNNLALKYATGTAGSFNTETVDNTTSADVGMYSSIAVESTNTVHIIYYDAINKDLLHAYGSAGSFASEVVDNSSDFNGYNSVALQSSTLHISYYDRTNGNLMYATGTGTPFSTVLIDSTGDVGEYSSIVVESNGTVHISYYDTTNGNLKYTRCSASCDQAANWSTKIVDNSVNVGEHSSIAVESDGTVHISYRDISNDSLKYATGTGGSFATEVVDNSGTVGEFSSIVVESNGTVHISYYDYINSSSGYLKYATR